MEEGEHWPFSAGVWGSWGRAHLACSQSHAPGLSHVPPLAPTLPLLVCGQTVYHVLIGCFLGKKEIRKKGCGLAFSINPSTGKSFG